jgi:hypothetical protein
MHARRQQLINTNKVKRKPGITEINAKSIGGNSNNSRLTTSNDNTLAIEMTADTSILACPPHHMLVSYAYGTPYTKLCGPTDPAFFQNSAS